MTQEPCLHKEDSRKLCWFSTQYPKSCFCLYFSSFLFFRLRVSFCIHHDKEYKHPSLLENFQVNNIDYRHTKSYCCCGRSFLNNHFFRNLTSNARKVFAFFSSSRKSQASNTRSSSMSGNA